MLRVCIGSGSKGKSKFWALIGQTDWSGDEGRWDGSKKVADVRNERNKYGIERRKEHERFEYKEDERIKKVKE